MHYRQMGKPRFIKPLRSTVVTDIFGGDGSKTLPEKKIHVMLPKKKLMCC